MQHRVELTIENGMVPRSSRVTVAGSFGSMSLHRSDCTGRLWSCTAARGDLPSPSGKSLGNPTRVASEYVQLVWSVGRTKAWAGIVGFSDQLQNKTTNAVDPDGSTDRSKMDLATASTCLAVASCAPNAAEYPGRAGRGRCQVCLPESGMPGSPAVQRWWPAIFGRTLHGRWPSLLESTVQ